MNIAVISYSYSGNNEALAESVAKELSAEHIKVVLQKPIKKVITILFGFIFNSSPEVQPPPEIIKKYDFVLFFAPVWMGHVAYPLRRYLNHLKKNPKPYGFLSISGGSMGKLQSFLMNFYKEQEWSLPYS